MRKILVLFILFSFGCSEEKKEPQINTKRTTKSLLPFRITEKEDVSYAGTSRLVVRVVVNVDKIPTESELKAIAKSIWVKKIRNWDEFTVFIYLPGMDTHSLAYGIGEYRPMGLKEFRIQKSTLYNTILSDENPKKVKNMKVVKITSDVANIRIANSADSKVICQGRKGETFRYIKTIGNWYEMSMYSGNYRYIHKSTAQITEKIDKFPLSGSKKRRFISELAKLEDKAAHDSGNDYTIEFIDRERELIDCYKLKLFRENNIATHLQRALFE